MSDRLERAIRELVAALRDELRDEGRQPDKLLSVDETAALLNVSRSKVYAELAAGRLRSLSIGDRRLVASGAIADYIAAKSPPGAAG